jgi:uncharacterized protein YndB with AHSA1/START domain
MQPPPRREIGPLADRILLKRVTLPGPAARAFAAWVEPTALQAWLCPRAIVEPCVGGKYELYWRPDDPENDSTIGCRFTAFERDQLLGFQWRSPAQFKSFANAADPLTHVVVTFHADATNTAVTLLHSGWRSTPEWQEAAAWQDRAWDYAFGALADYVAAPPT